MYGPPGIAYVYLVYGMHDCLNIVSDPPGRPAALLVRAVEPLAGIEAMIEARARRTRARRRAGRDPAPVRATGPDEAPPTLQESRPAPGRIASGPGLVAAAFDIDRSLTGLDLFDPFSPLRIESAPPDEPAPEVVRGPRVGIAYAEEPWRSRPWRLSIAGHPSVSRPRPELVATPEPD